MQSRLASRPEWASLPERVRARVGDAAGVRADVGETAATGFSVGFAGPVGVGDERVFVKAASRSVHPDSFRFHRREAEVLASLPAGVGPRLIAVVEEGDWVAVVTELLPGRSPTGPWRPDDLRAVTSALGDLSRVAAPGILGGARNAYTDGPTGWANLLAEPAAASALSPALREAGPALDAAERAGIAEAVDGDSLVHHDIRSDNLVLTKAGARFVDWPHALRGAPWLDTVLFAPSAAADGGTTIDDVYALRFGDAVPREVALVTAAWGARLWWMAHLPEPAQLAGLRSFQFAQAAPALDWVERHLDVIL